ncbi:DUF3306 domain-containing protein [Roseobacter denitrificans]|uniref:DUF3306 domain-containing protein n=1 Tax=Roseobacter denitrificans (strain ATCC 33942 / OCh 114) TaxID=375451 RepID=Q165B9_ROSDO|nr:DUF3306 domain-containing protein [Roseobacter denitrificans]ABG32424.1 hypothetical protein RD1_2900 [Roseobacter denitrificans OCh 114]AVL51890.1 DUF3306 domain-containing protein [Roseobacter denitrificans]SFF81649.1 Protein of unknown function [Roseobacter denitrificans OCh 114]
MSGKTTFWARRRAAVQAEADAELRATEEAQAQARAEALAEKDDAEVLQEMGLPDPALLQQGDDFSAFMARDVPERLRRQALRTLWRSNPVLACVDGLNEYDDDYRAAMLLSEPVKTAYQVGKGMTKHIEEMQRQAEAAEATEEESVAEVEDDAVIAQVQESDVPAVEQEEPAPARSEHSAEAEEAAPSPRRMRFQFEEASA